MRNVLRRNRGITLIALIITIIILLILAGITVALLTGDNGLIGKTGEAKNATEEAAIKEELEVNVLASYKKANINYDLLNSKLANINGLKYKENSLSDTNKIEKLPDWIEVKGYKFDILEDGTVEKRPDYETLRSMYGTVLNGYDAGKDLDETKKVDSWKLFYVDEENKDAFFISSNICTLSGAIPLISSKGIEYTGSNEVLKFEYGKKYNSLWLNACTSESKNENAQATAYLCDPSNWEQYKTGKAKYAVGGPTFEMLIASAKNKQVKDINSIISTVNSNGYSLNINAEINLEKSELYNIQKYYWISSPRQGGTSHMIAVRRDGGLDYYSNVHTMPRFRPVVCFSASAIKIDGDKLSI